MSRRKAAPAPASTRSDATLYEVLDLPPATPRDAIQERYRVLTRQHHPDIGGDHDTFCRITEAGSVLLDDERRSEYDRRLRLLRTPCATCEGAGRVFIQHSFTTRSPKRCASCNGVGYV